MQQKWLQVSLGISKSFFCNLFFLHLNWLQDIVGIIQDNLLEYFICTKNGCKFPVGFQNYFSAIYFFYHDWLQNMSIVDNRYFLRIYFLHRDWLQHSSTFYEDFFVSYFCTQIGCYILVNYFRRNILWMIWQEFKFAPKLAAVFKYLLPIFTIVLCNI